MNPLRPQIEAWYMDPENGQLFEIIAIDEEAQEIEIQYFDGSLEELDFETWEELVLETVPPPEDWSGPFDDIKQSDMDSGISPTHSDIDDDPLEVIEKPFYD